MMVAPYTPFRELLTEFLARPGMEEEMDAWRDAPSTPGHYKGIWDGEVWRTLKDAEGRLFFAKRDDELRIGLTAAFDE